MEKIPVIIDTDPGHDDAIALMAALAADEWDIRGITVVAGNNTMDNNTNNALRILEHFGRDIKVYRGAPKPMIQRQEVPEDIHGKSGMDGTSLPDFARGRAEEKNAAQFLEDELKSTDQRIKIIAIGPLTNLGILLAAAPEVKDSIDEIVIMGGAALGGNKTPTTEFNIWQDPEAAHIVFSSGIPLTMCGLDVTYQSALFEDDLQRIAALPGKAGKLATEILTFYGAAVLKRGNQGIAIHDAVAVAKILRPELFTSRMCNVVIDLDGKYTRGCTVTDLDDVTKAHKNVEVVLDVQREAFVDYLVGALEKLDAMGEGSAHD